MHSLINFNLQLRTKIPNNKNNILKFLSYLSTIKPNGSIININPTKKLHMDEFIYFKKKTFDVETNQRVGKRDCRNINLPQKISLWMTINV